MGTSNLITKASLGVKLTQLGGTAAYTQRLFFVVGEGLLRGVGPHFSLQATCMPLIFTYHYQLEHSGIYIQTREDLSIDAGLPKDGFKLT